MLDSVLMVWFLLTIASTAYVACDLLAMPRLGQPTTVIVPRMPAS